MNRIAYFDASWDVLVGMMLSQPMHAIDSTLPDDAKAHHLVLDDVRRQVRIFFTSETLDEVPEGAVIPMFDPYLRRTDALVEVGA